MKRVVQVVLFVVLCALGIIYLNGAVQPNKDRAGIWRTFHKLENNSLDVLFVGTSKIYTVFNPAYLWDKYHFTSYDIAGPMLDPQTQYYYVKEVFKTQHPKVVVLDAYITTDKEPELRPMQKENIVIMPFGLNKVSAILNDRIPAQEREKWLFPLEQYHSRFFTVGEIKKNNILERNFKKEKKNVYFGYRAQPKPVPQAVEDKPMPVERNSFNANYAGMRKTLDFLREQNCRVVLVTTPTANVSRLQNHEQELMKRMKKEYPNVSYVWARDHLDEAAINYTKDYADDIHLTIFGAEKFSKFFGAYLFEQLNKDMNFKSAAYGVTLQMFNKNRDRYARTYAALKQAKQ